MSLDARFKAIPRASRAGAFALDSSEGAVRVGRSFEGHPAVVFHFASNGTGSVARKLANLSYSPPALVEVNRANDAPQMERLAVLECRSAEVELHDYFLRTVETVLFDGPALVSEAKFDRALDALVRLFTSLTRSARMSVQGLWAEVAIIVWANDTGAAVSAWHSNPRALHDFAAGAHRLEVKSTSKTLREHAFALDQLSEVTGGETLIASVMLLDRGGGHSVHDLLDVVRRSGRLAREQLERLEVVAAESLGEDWQDAHDLRFDLEAARSSLLIFPVNEIPTVAVPVPPAVKDVRFVADLSGCTSLGLPVARSLGPFFASVLPT